MNLYSFKNKKKASLYWLDVAGLFLYARQASEALDAYDYFENMIFENEKDYFSYLVIVIHQALKPNIWQTKNIIKRARLKKLIDPANLAEKLTQEEALELYDTVLKVEKIKDLNRVKATKSAGRSRLSRGVARGLISAVFSIPYDAVESCDIVTYAEMLDNAANILVFQSGGKLKHETALERAERMTEEYNFLKEQGFFNGGK